MAILSETRSSCLGDFGAGNLSERRKPKPGLPKRLGCPSTRGFSGILTKKGLELLTVLVEDGAGGTLAVVEWLRLGVKLAFFVLFGSLMLPWRLEFIATESDRLLGAAGLLEPLDTTKSLPTAGAPPGVPVGVMVGDAPTGSGDLRCAAVEPLPKGWSHIC